MGLDRQRCGGGEGGARSGTDGAVGGAPCDMNATNSTSIVDVIGKFRPLKKASHPPTWYLPPADVATDLLRPAGRRTICEFKGQARYADIVLPDRTIPLAGWHYPDPRFGFEDIAD